MNKITRGAAAFAKRVMIGGRRVWFITEGKNHDVRFYDLVMRTSGVLVDGDYDVRPGESIKSHDGSSAGGKKRLLALHDYYRRKGELVQTSKEGSKAIFFLLDKDVDNLTNRMRRTPHVVYTEYGDVESEIFARGDIERALADTLGLTRAEAEAARLHLGHPLKDLSELWHQWILLGAITAAHELKVNLKTRGPSLVNSQTYGPVSQDEVQKCMALIAANSRYSPSKHAWVASRLESRRRRGELHRDLKGKHLPAYIEWRMRAYFRTIRSVDYSGFGPTISKVMLSTVKFDRSWTGRWVDQVEAVLTQQDGADGPPA